MPQTLGDFLVKRLRGWNITRIFGFPGGYIDTCDVAKQSWKVW